MNPALVARLLASTAALAVSVYAPPLSAQSPQSPTVAAGSIAVTRQGTTTVVTQGTDKGIIDWRTFSIGPQESVRFDQPGRSSVTLNRVTSSEISRIDGNLSANGQVWISNPNGLIIGPGGQVNVGGLLATTGRIDATEFLKSGRAAIDQIGKDAAIVNSGAITVGEGGYAALAAAAIRNEGVIAARSGSIALGSGKAVTVDFAGDKLITYQVTQPLDEAPAGADSAVSSNGTLAAQGGTVLLSARAAKGVMDNVVNLKGLVVSNSVKVDGGTVVFGDGGSVQVSAKIDATNAAGQGGSVAVLGEKVGLMDGAAIDASGATGGGTVLVGGDWQGKGLVQNAEVAYVASTASIKVDATQQGDGGKAVVWANDTTRFNGTISARGGALGGDGGQVETSGKRTLLVGDAAQVNTANRSAAGRAGAWLLDPFDITIAAGGSVSYTGSSIFQPTGSGSTIAVGVINSALASGDVTIQTAAGAGNGDILFTGGTISTSSGTIRTLKLLADRNIDMQAGTAISMSGAAHNVILNSGANYTAQNTVLGGIQVVGASITTTGGAISLVGGLNGAFRAVGSASGGPPFLSGVVVQGSVIDAGAGSITVRGEANPVYNSSGGAGTYIINNGATGATLTAGGGITIEGFGAPISSDSSTGLIIGSFAAGTSTKVLATGTGTISLIGRRGSGNSAKNIDLFTSGPTPTISSVGGAIIIDGTYSGGTGANSHGVTLQSALVTTATGTINITGAGASSGGASDGVSLGAGSTNSTVSTTGAGLILINGTAGGAGAGITNYQSTLTSTGGNITLTTDNLVVNSSNFSATGGTITYQPTASTVPIGITPGAGTLQISNSALSAVTGGDLLIGRSDLTANISVNSNVTLSANTTLRTGGGSINVVGLLDAATAGGQSLKINAPGGTVTFGGNVGGNYALSSIDVQAGLITNSAAFNHSFITTGTQSWSAPLLLTGNGATQTSFSSTNANITFGGAIDSNIGEQSLLFSAGTGTVSLAGAIGNALSANFVEYYGSGSGKLITNNLIKSVRAQAYYGPVTTQTGATFYANGWSITFNNTLDGPGPITVDTVQANALASFNGVIGGVTPLASFTRTGGPTVFGPAGTLVQTVGAQTYVTGGTSTSAAITLAAPNTTFATSGSAINFAGPIDSASTLSYAGMTVAAGSGTVTLGNNFGAGTNLASFTSTGTGLITLGGIYGTQGTQSYNGALLLQGSPTFNTINSDVIFNGQLNAATAGFQTIAANVGTGTVSFVNGVGGTSALGSLSLVKAALGGAIITSGTQSYSGAVRFTSNATLNTNNNAITFNGTLDGPGGLDLVAGTATVSLGASVGATNPLAYLNKLGGGLALLQGTITTAGSQSYSGPVSLTNALMLSTSNADVTFTGTINGGQSFNTATGSGGTATITGGVGGTAPLLSMMLGRAAIGGTISTTGAFATTGPSRLVADTVLNSAGGGAQFFSTLDGPGGLTLSSGTGLVQFSGAVGGTAPLAFLNSGRTGVTRPSAAITTSGSQSYAGAIEIQTGGGGFTTSNSPIVFAGPVDAATAGVQGMTVNTGSGPVTFGNNFGVATSLASFTQIGTGPVLLGGTYVTTGAQSYANAVLTGNASFTTTNNALVFGSLNGSTPGSQTIFAALGSGTVSIVGGSGGSTPLGGLNFPSAAALGGTIVTMGAQSYTGPVILLSNTKLSSNNNTIVLSSGIDGAGGLDLVPGSGGMALGGTIGGTTPLAYFNSAATNPLTINGTIITAGSQSYAGALVLGGNATLSTNNGPLFFAGPIDASTVGGYGMTVSAGTGAVSFGNNFGAGTALSSFTQLGTGMVTLGGTYVTTGAQSYAGSLVLAGANVSFNAGGALVMTGPVNGATPGANSGQFGGASTTLSGGVGATTPLAGLNLGAATLGGTIATTGTQSFGGALTLTGATSFSSSSGIIVFSSNVTGAFDLQASASQIQLGTGGAIQINTTGATQSYAGAVSLFNDATLTAALVRFNSTLDGASPNAQSLAVNGGTLSLGGAVGGTNPLNNLLNSAGSVTVITGPVTTGGSQSYGGAVLLANTVPLTTVSGNATFAGTIDSQGAPASLIVNVGANAANFIGAIGGATPLAFFSVNSTGTNVNLPATTAGTLSIASNGGTVVGTGALNISGTASFNAGAGSILLGGYPNDFNSIALVTTGSAAIQDGTGGLSILAAQATTGLTLNVTGAVTQVGPIDTTSLVVGGGGNFTLTGTNTIGTLSGSGPGSITVANSSTPGLTVGNLTGSAITLTQSGAGAYINVTGLVSTAGGANLMAPGNIDVNGTLSAGTASLNSGGTISGLGTISITSAPLAISANGGSIDPIVNGVSGPAVASTAYINVTSGSITVSGSPLSATTATVASTPSVASVPTVATVTTVATVASVATVATVVSVATTPSVASVATVATSATVASQATTPSSPSQPTNPLAPVISGDPSTGNQRDSFFRQILNPPVTFPGPGSGLDLSGGALTNGDSSEKNPTDPTGTQPTQSGGQSNNQPAGGNASPSAAVQQRTNAVNNAPAGTIVPALPNVPGSNIPSPQTLTRTVSPLDVGFGGGASLPGGAGGGGAPSGPPPVGGTSAGTKFDTPGEMIAPQPPAGQPIGRGVATYQSATSLPPEVTLPNVDSPFPSLATITVPSD